MAHHIHGDLARLLHLCRGRGIVAAVAPSGQDKPHSFYAGTSIPPRVSFLEALLLALGGDLEDGSRRYDEIVVVNAGTNVDAFGLDKPREEILRIPLLDRSHLVMGEVWGGWHYRLPPTPSPDDKPDALDTAPPGGGRNPLAGGMAAARQDRWAARSPGRDRPLTEDGFPRLPPRLQIKDQRGLEYPHRLAKLRALVEELSQRSHRTLLLLEIGVLDYDEPQDVAAEHSQISTEGLRDLNWFEDWVNEYALEGGPLDLVIYGRNRRRVDALFQSGLPGRPERWELKWPALRYRGQNIVRVAYPCGRYPWGDGFSNDSGFSPESGTENDRPDRRRKYHQRTLPQLLSGRGSDGGLTRLRFASPRPTPPPHPGCTSLISREFWSSVDVDLLELTLAREFFGSKHNPAIVNLLRTLRLMKTEAQRIEDPRSFHNAVSEDWRRASSMLLWGVGGTGKSYLGKCLASLLFGHDGHLFHCETAGGGGAGDSSDTFARTFFGSPPSYIGSDKPTSTTEHLMGTQGFTVLIIDEVNLIAPHDFAASIKPLYGVLFDRTFAPPNGKQTATEPISLWNSLIVLTGNLSQFPPPGVETKDLAAIRRRLFPCEFTSLDQERAEAFAQWYLRRAVEETLDGVAVCHCDDLIREVRRLDLQTRTMDELRGELAPVVERVRNNLYESGVRQDSCPLFLDITEHVHQGLTS